MAAVVHFGTTLYNNTKISIARDILQKIQMRGIEIVVKLQANIKGVITDKIESKLNIESIIPHTNENTGFLIWFGKSTLVDSLFNLVNTKIGGKIVNYTIQFLSCFSKLTNSERKKVMMNHRQSYIKDNIAPAVKQQKLEAKQFKYKM